jgi:hypothetical protein
MRAKTRLTLTVPANEINLGLFSRDFGALPSRAARTYKKPTGLASDPASLTWKSTPRTVYHQIPEENDPTEIFTNWGGVEMGSSQDVKMSRPVKRY